MSATGPGQPADPPRDAAGDAAVDAHLRAALRHAPDASTGAPPLLRARIVAAAHRSADASRRAQPWHQRLTQGLSAPWRMGGAGTLAAALLAATVLWVGRDEQPAAPSSRSTPALDGALKTSSQPPPGAPPAVAAAPAPADLPATAAPSRSTPVERETQPAANAVGGSRPSMPRASPAPEASAARLRQAPAATQERERRTAEAAQPPPTAPVRSEAATGSASPQETVSATPAAPAAPPRPSAAPAAVERDQRAAAEAPQSPSAAAATPHTTPPAPFPAPGAVPRVAAPARGDATAERRAGLAAAGAAAQVPLVATWHAAAGEWRWRAANDDEGLVPPGWFAELAAAAGARWAPLPARSAEAALQRGEPALVLLLGGHVQGQLIWAADAVMLCAAPPGRCETAPLDAQMQSALRQRLRR
jgi:hypothetical protein